MKHSKKTCKYIIIRGLKAECSKNYKHSEVDRTLLHPFFITLLHTQRFEMTMKLKQ